MGIIGLLILGLVAGAIAKALMPGNDPGGIIMTMVLGVVGAFVGAFLASAVLDTGSPLDGLGDLSTWLAAIVGSLIVLGIYRAVAGRSARRSGTF